jgi:hypothetical protein
MAYPSASCLGKLTAPLAPTRTREALVPDDRGLSPVIARVGDLGPTNAICFAGAWQVAFLGEAARCSTRKTCPASDASRTAVGPAVNDGRRMQSAGHFSGTAGTSPTLPYSPMLRWLQTGWVPWHHWRKGDRQWMRLRRISQPVARHGKGRTCSFFVSPCTGHVDPGFGRLPEPVSG